ncbi:MAG: UDP-N-acetylglucosamine 1-carboxyvinyltransferase [Clostridiales bacterium]|jgi:UDP-N-acetylglucosamine 1-carboxyvinyltransferase|nr:UDP-N-acetylglucosamine 1-carboxyvinyltransferase [Clostridiales bacterium]
MERIIIQGKKRLAGSVDINGAKNASVAILASALSSRASCVVENLPYIEDVLCVVDGLKSLGAKCQFLSRHTLMIDSSNITDYMAIHESLKKIRASYYFVGALLGRFKKAEVILPGGCNFGSRPIDLHQKGFEALGAKVSIEHGLFKAHADKLTGAHIYLDTASVGATINIMLAAVYAEGVTIIENAAKEPHVVDTAGFLNSMGARIRGAGTYIIRVTGVKALRGSTYAIIPDQIEAGTYMIASAITGGDITVRNIIPQHMDSLSAKLKEMRCEVIEGDDYIRIVGSGKLSGTNIKTTPYPGFPTDLQPQMTALLCVADNSSMLTEGIWENRFQYVDELRRFGANISVKGRTAFIEGNIALTGAEVSATDLRAGVALVIAGLAAEGVTTINDVKYIDRGYENIESKLGALGADIKRVTVKS